MALKIISNDDTAQEDKDINYPCLMESINNSHEVVVLALDPKSAIAIKNTFDPSSVGVVVSNWSAFDSREDWKPYDKPITFCNA